MDPRGKQSEGPAWEFLAAMATAPSLHGPRAFSSLQLAHPGPGRAAGAAGSSEERQVTLLLHTGRGRWRLDAAGRGAARADGEPGAVRVALQRGRPTPGLQAHGPVPEENEEALEGGDDAEEVEDNKLEGARSKGEEDHSPGQAKDQTEAQQGQHVGPLLGVWAQPQDLHHHGAQHGCVEQKHQAE